MYIKGHYIPEIIIYVVGMCVGWFLHWVVSSGAFNRRFEEHYKRRKEQEENEPADK